MSTVGRYFHLLSWHVGKDILVKDFRVAHHNFIYSVANQHRIDGLSFDLVGYLDAKRLLNKGMRNVRSVF